jgi:dUTP pyrophosphatase
MINMNVKCNKVRVKFKKLHEDAIVPRYAHSTDACFDLHALEGGELRAHRSVLVKTGLAYALPEDWEIQVRPRSGPAYKNMITVLNTPGTIDEDYRGDLGVILINHSNSVFKWDAGDRIAQGSLKPVYRAVFEEDDLGETDRGNGGFGSTGIKKID